MADGAEIEDRVDFDEDTYSEDIDDDFEEQIEKEGAGGGGHDDFEEQIEKEGAGGGGHDSVEEEIENSEVRVSGKDQLLEGNGMQTAAGSVEGNEMPTVSSGEGDKEKYAQLLSLPPHGSEIFIGGLPRDILEDDLRDLCEPIGKVCEVRMIRNRDTGESKGYAFISFLSKEVAQKAIEELHNKEFKGRTMRCSLSESKNRLFVGNIPKSWTDDDFRKVIEEVGPGIDNVELIKDPLNPSRNRGFAFIEYYNNACADHSRQKMSSANFRLDGNAPTVSWADPKISPDHSAAAQVKALYVKNIPENTATEQLKELFERHGEVTKVVLPPSRTGQGKRDFGFVHFAERSSALKALKDTEKYEIHGEVLEVTLAKPQTDKKFDGSPQHNSGFHLSHPAGYGGFPGNAYGSLGTGYGVTAGFQQPMIYGRGPMPSGMQMVPMVLPDGRIGYVLQQPGAAQMSSLRPRRNDRSNGLNGPQGRGIGGADEGNRGRRYRPY